MTDDKRAPRARDGWHRGLHGLVIHVDDETEGARARLVDSARTFSARTSEIVDDKLTFSATLVRAGEVTEAERLLAEVEREVRSEQESLIRHIDAARSVRRHKVTRARLTRLLAVAILGASAMSFSAVGMAIAGMFAERESTVAARDGRHRGGKATSLRGDGGTRSGRHRADASAPGRGKESRAVHRVVIGDVHILMTASQLAEYRELIDHGTDPTSLQTFLAGVVPAGLIGDVEKALGTVSAVPTIPPAELPTAAERRRAQRAEAAPAEEDEQPATPAETEDPPEEPADEPADDSEEEEERSGDGRRRSGGRNSEGKDGGEVTAPPDVTGDSQPIL